MNFELLTLKVCKKIILIKFLYYTKDFYVHVDARRIIIRVVLTHPGTIQKMAF